MKAILLAGGFGSRLSEETTHKPKPMVEIGGRPILWHIMNILGAHGIDEFIIALGYKGEVVKQYFLNFYAVNSDLTIDLRTGRQTIYDGSRPDWRVHLVHTGITTQTGGRVKRLRNWLADDETFLMTYGDGVADVNVTDYDQWLSHITYNGVESGQQIGDALAEAIGGSGGIIALQGILDTGAAKDRFAGLEESLSANPDVKLLDQQTANFSRDEALAVTKTLLTKHGDDIKGIWAANDDMALGALAALEQAGRDDVAVVGIDAVPDALTAIEDGAMTATVSSDGPWQGGIGLAIGYCVATGELSVEDIADEDRAWFAEQFLITGDNVGEFTAPVVDEADFACDNVFSRSQGAIS